MKRLVRLTEEDLMKVMRNSVQRALQEGYVGYEREIRLAQKELYQMGKNLPGVGMRLEGTKYHALYKRMADAMIELNQQLIKHIRGEK